MSSRIAKLVGAGVTRRQLVIGGVAASVGAIAITLMAATGIRTANDFYTEAGPSYLALMHGHLGRFLQLVPIYGGSLELRAPFAMIPALWGGGLRTVYFASALPCMLADVLFCIWLAAQPRMQAAGWSTRLAAAACCCILNPIVLVVLLGGHPEEILGAVLCVSAVMLASKGRAGWAGLIVGLAVANKSWALVAVPVVVAALPAQRRRALLVAGVVAAVVLLPIAAVRDHGISAAANGADVGGVLFNPPQLLWWFGHHSWLVHQARPGIVLASLLLTLLWWAVRRNRITQPRSGAPDALLLLALLLLLRAAFDPLNNLWYHLPFLFALLAWEVRAGRPPLFTTLASVALLIIVPVRGVPMSYDLRAALYAALVLPPMFALAARLYLSPSGHVLGAAQRAAAAVGARRPELLGGRVQA